MNGDIGTASSPRVGENTVSSNVTKQIKDVPFSHGAKAEFSKFKRDLITLAKQHSLFWVFTEDVEIPVADEEKSVEEIQAIGFAEDEILKHFLAWNILSYAIKAKTDNNLLRRVTSPTAAWRILVGSYSATTRGAKLQRMNALTNRRVKPGSNLVHTLSEMADDARDLRANGTDILDEIVCLLFLQVLPQEYDVFRHIIEREKEPLTINGLMGELRARFDLSRKVKPRSSDIALVASGSRREKSERVGAKHNVMRKKPSSSRGDNSAGSATTSGKEGRKVSCSICKETGHKWFKWSQRICSICRETGHDPHKCPKMKRRTRTWRFRIKRAWSRMQTPSSPFLKGSGSFVLVVRGESRGQIVRSGR